MASVTRVGLFIAIGSILFGIAGLHYVATWHSVHLVDGTVVAIRSLKTGRYLSVSKEDGLIRVAANSSSEVAARFRMLTLTVSTVRMLHPVKVQHRSTSKRGCACSGFSDEHGFGRFCHPWESEFHRPWCYVEDSCKHAQKHRKLRKHQACASEEGYLSEGYVPPKGCPCSGHESGVFPSIEPRT
jgi:hypothetical protein